MKLANVENGNNRLQVQRLNIAYLADIRNGIKFWLFSLIFFGAFHLLTVGLNKLLQWASSAPIHVFPSETQMLLLALLSAFVVAANLLPDLGLLHSQSFAFDAEKAFFSVDGRHVTSLDEISVHLQDGFGPSRRALRIVVNSWSRSYVVAQTPRFTTATLAGKEYPSTATSEGMQQKHWFNQWADYAGAKTGFSSKWPEYQEIFALYAELTKLVNASQNKQKVENEV